MILVTPAQMESIDRATIQERGLSSLVLMESAARSVLPLLPSGPATILVGPGNNGGDGLVLARALHEQGRDARCFLLSDKLSPDAEIQLALAKGWGVPMIPLWEEGHALPAFTSESIIIDALFGTGLSRELSGRYARVLEASNSADAYRVAVDIPSGIDGSSGRILGSSFKADLTVTFGVAKWGHVLYPGKERCGRLEVTQPGFHPDALRAHQAVRYVTRDLASSMLPADWATMHKGDNGRVLLLTGSDTYPGAGILSTLGAIHGGAGLVSHAATEALRSDIMSWVPETLLLDRESLEEISSFNVLVLGSGLGSDTESHGRELLERFEGPIVVDADALKLVPRFARERRRNWILTPHPGELSRLLDRSVAELEKDRIGTALEAAEHLGAVVCFKGATTVCASPDGRALVNSSGHSVLAQGGSGDVLAGLIGAYVAYGLPTLEATAAAVYVHGLAAELLASDGKPRGVGAHAIAACLPRAFGVAVGKAEPSAVL